MIHINAGKIKQTANQALFVFSKHSPSRKTQKPSMNRFQILHQKESLSKTETDYLVRSKGRSSCPQVQGPR
jgi:hypothetical protein